MGLKGSELVGKKGRNCFNLYHVKQPYKYENNKFKKRNKRASLKENDFNETRSIAIIKS